MAKDEAVTLMVRGLSVAEIMDKLGGMGRDKPIKAMEIGDLFDRESRVKAVIDKVFNGDGREKCTSVAHMIRAELEK